MSPENSEKTTPAKNAKHRPDADEICAVAEQYYEFVRDAITGDLFAVNTETKIAQPLSSKGEFRHRLSWLTRGKYGCVPRSQSLTEALETLQGMAQEQPSQPIHLRIAETKNKVWIDTMDADNHLILLEDGDWRITDSTECGAPIFRRSQVMKPMIVPVKSADPFLGAFKKLWTVVNVPVEYRCFIMAWMIHALIHENSAYPILYFSAEQGSGKTTAGRRIVELVDPSIDTGGALPKDEAALAVAALSSRVLVFDNLSTIRPESSDTLCRIATGGTVRRRKLYSDSDEKIYEIRRPVLLTAIDLGTNPPDLTNRMVKAELHRLEQSQRKSDDELETLWNSMKGEVFGALLSLSAKVMQKIHSGELDGIEKPRMADFGMVLAALDALMDSSSLKSYKLQQKNMAVEASSEEPVYIALQKQRKSLKFRNGWEGTASKLLGELRQVFSAISGDEETWRKPPRTAAELSRKLRICSPSLRQSGWTVETTKGTGNNSGSLIWHLTAPKERE